MNVVVSWWDLAGSGQTVDSLRRDLCEDTVLAWSAIDGLVLKMWMADRASERWGAVMVWANGRPPVHALPPNRARDLIGCAPTVRVEFEVEAVSKRCVDVQSMSSTSCPLCA